ncbi:hypothetical protein ONS96_005063 [Cadophora gregata f. sp. sojae]|nr:hypothetical protein ONS96_005063 [Cadophora gregata f. sp. sojae]
MKFSTVITATLSLATSAFSSSLPLQPRQSTTWQYTCQPNYAAPSNFKAFNLGGCAAQLTFTKDRYVGVHEFTNVCKNGAAPVSWIFYTSSANSACSSDSYRYTGGRIPVFSNGAVVTRPAKPASYSLRRINVAGDFEVNWSAVSTAAAYSIIVQYPTGTDEVGNPYTNQRGARVQAPNLTTIIPTGTRRQDQPRSLIVHAVDSRAVWSFTNDAKIVRANW